MYTWEAGLCNLGHILLDEIDILADVVVILRLFLVRKQVVFRAL